MPVIDYQRITCDRCFRTVEVPRPSRAQAAELQEWISLDVRNLSGATLGADLKQSTVLCRDCRKNLVTWFQAGVPQTGGGEQCPSKKDQAEKPSPPTSKR